jgi:serine/threonine-protein kinase
VKPGNIVLCRHPRRPDHVKVLDFGLVKRIDRSDPELSAADAIAGTPLYLAPECITSPDDVDERSDLYGLGAVGYYLLTAQPIRLGGSVVEVLARALHEPVVPPSERLGRAVPASLERIVLSCLAKNPSERPPNASALCAKLLVCDDVPPWTTEDATRWWQTRGNALAGDDDSAPAHVGPFSATLAVAPRPRRA